MYQDENTLDNAGTLGTPMNQQFVEGTDVYDAGGDKVGTVSEHGIQDNCLVIHHGMFRQDIYIPLNIIQRNDVDGVYLNLYKDDILNRDWNAPPVNETMTTGAATMDVTNNVTNANVVQEEDVRVPVREEELVVGKQQEEIGRVHLHKDVVEEQETIEAPVMREEVRVERVPVQSQDLATDADAFVEKDIDVPVMGEELVAGKRAVVKEEVRLEKDAITQNQQVSGTVRKERVTVEGVDDNMTTDDTITTTPMNTTDTNVRVNRNQ